MCLWQRFFFIILYLTMIFVSSLLLEMILLYETGYTSYQIVKPLHSLSVSQLKALLNGRGIQFTTILEKSEIIEFLNLSGFYQRNEESMKCFICFVNAEIFLSYLHSIFQTEEDAAVATCRNVHYLELLGALNPPHTKGPIEILNKDEFYEQIVEEEESIWVIEIIPGDGKYTGSRILDLNSWKELDEKLKFVGINTAIVRCNHEPSLCTRYGWSHPQLMMTVPKSNSDIKWKFHFPSASRLSVHAILQWVHIELSRLTESIGTLEELENTWLNSSLVKTTKIPQMIYFTELLNPPLLLVVFGLRFSSRIRLSIFSTRKFDKEAVSKTLHTNKIGALPNIVVTCGDSVSTYGNKKGELLTVGALDIYVRFLQPKMNDIFLISLVVTNFLAFADLLDYRGSLWKHLVRTVVCIPVYNILIFVTWLTLSAMVKFTWMKPILDMGTWIIREIVCTGMLGVLLYYCVIAYYYKCVTLVALVLFGVLVYGWRKVMGRSSQYSPEQDGDSWYIVFPMDSYLVNVLFRPMASLSRPRPSHDFDLEEGMERLIERLATPDLWLHPVLPTDYIKDLPTWRYDGWGNEEDLKSESETDFDSLSETESDYLLESHSCCQDDGCKMCTLWATVKETYVCHRCAILKRKLEKKYLKYRNSGDNIRRDFTYEKLLRVCDNCSRTRRNQSNGSNHSKFTDGYHERNKRDWLISPQKLYELGWSAPQYAIESRLCAICLDRYRWSAVLCGLPCGHTYHHSCIMEWLSKDNHHCPTCRWPPYKTKVG